MTGKDTGEDNCIFSGKVFRKVVRIGGWLEFFEFIGVGDEGPEIWNSD